MIEVGDKLKVRSDLEIHQMYNGMEFVYEMTDMLGKEVTIARKKKSSNGTMIYKIMEDVCDFWYTEDMFEEVEVENDDEELRAYRVTYTTDIDWNAKPRLLLYKGDITLDKITKLIEKLEGRKVLKIKFWEVDLGSVKLSDVSVSDYLKYLK